VSSSVFSLDGYDPLSTDPADAETEMLINESNRRIVLNILKSYTGYFDLFSELIQNSLDAVEAASKVRGENYTPTIWIELDIPGSSLKVTDTGCSG
jgi:hypothetical protein